jgi:hypothetical protein
LKNELCVKNRKDERIAIRQLINKSFDQKGFSCISITSKNYLKKIQFAERLSVKRFIYFL